MEVDTERIFNILNWLATYWYFVIPLLLTELLPFLPTKANGIVQAIVNIIGKLKAGPPVALLVILILAGCATTESAQSLTAKSLLTSRQAVISSAQAADDLCTQDIMKQADCDKARELYKQGQAAYNAAADGFLLYLQTGSVSDEAQLAALSARLSNINMDLTALLQAFGGGGK